jgi:glycerophosphoryl diester phosphodiesterase
MNSIVVHGHRGSRGTNPENTLPSFIDAKNAGAEFVELDVHLSKDKQLIVFHDTMISERLCRDQHGQKVQTPVPVNSLTVAQLKTYDCGRADAKILTLEELIQWKLNDAPKMRLNVEIKHEVSADAREASAVAREASAAELANAVLKMLGQYDLTAGSLVQSFDFTVVRALRALDQKIRLSCLFEHAADFAKETLANQAQVAAIHYKLLNGENVRQCQEAGLEVLPWTVNEESEWQRMVDIGVRAIITDFPKRLKEFRFR